MGFGVRIRKELGVLMILHRVRHILNGAFGWRINGKINLFEIRKLEE